MTEETEILVEFWKEDWNKAKHHDDQRSNITNLIIIIAAILIGFVAQVGLHPKILPVTILLIILGLYGIITVEKLYELHQYHLGRMRHFRRRIDELHPNVQIMKLIEASRKDHYAKYPKISKIRFHYLWSVLHIAITIIGIVATLLSIIG